jgi:hypothetical protein
MFPQILTTLPISSGVIPLILTGLDSIKFEIKNNDISPAIEQIIEILRRRSSSIK